MHRNVVPLAAAVLTQALALGSLIGTAHRLPAKVASHFNGAGDPDGWMDRGSYLWTMAGVEAGLALLILGSFYGMRNFPRAAINLPHREYWLSENRRAETFDIMFRAGAWLASLVAVLFCGLHLLVVVANSSQPVRLSGAAWLLLAGFLAAMAVWAVSLVCQFQRIAQTE
jgi:hypothetical protein